MVAIQFDIYRSHMLETLGMYKAPHFIYPSRTLVSIIFLPFTFVVVVVVLLAPATPRPALCLGLGC